MYCVLWSVNTQYMNSLPVSNCVFPLWQPYCIYMCNTALSSPNETHICCRHPADQIIIYFPCIYHCSLLHSCPLYNSILDYWSTCEHSTQYCIPRCQHMCCTSITAASFVTHTHTCRSLSLWIMSVCCCPSVS